MKTNVTLNCLGSHPLVPRPWIPIKALLPFLMFTLTHNACFQYLGPTSLPEISKTNPLPLYSLFYFSSWLLCTHSLTHSFSIYKQSMCQISSKALSHYIWFLQDTQLPYFSTVSETPCATLSGASKPKEGKIGKIILFSQYLKSIWGGMCILFSFIKMVMQVTDTNIDAERCRLFQKLSCPNN